jgi:hypothetical protein
VILEAIESDVDQIVEMGAAFAQEEYSDRLTVTPEALRQMALNLIHGDQSVLWVARKGEQVIGMLGLVVYVHPMNGEMVASELVWWMRPEHRGRAGLRLLRTGERWARARSAVALQMIAPNHRVESLYQALGYQQVETTYQRRIA